MIRTKPQVDTVPWNKIRPAQDKLLMKHLDRHRDGSTVKTDNDLPEVVRGPNGEYHIMEGHHRLAAAKLRGEAAKVLVTGNAPTYKPPIKR